MTTFKFTRILSVITERREEIEVQGESYLEAKDNAVAEAMQDRDALSCRIINSEGVDVTEFKMSYEHSRRVVGADRRCKLTKAQKAEIATIATRGDRTLVQVADMYGITPVYVAKLRDKHNK